MRVFLQAIFGQILLNAYIYWRGRKALPKSKLCHGLFILFFVVELSLFFFGYFFHEELSDEVLIPILYICNTWYIATIYITICLLVMDVLRLIHHFYPWFPKPIIKHWSRVKAILFVAIVCGVSLLMLNAYLNVRYPVVRHLYIEMPKKESGRDSLTIVMMSDIHIGETIGKKQVQHIVSLCNQQKPDIVVVPGDMIDHESLIAENDKIDEELNQLKAPLGVYYSLGNHEYRANRYAKLRWLNKLNGTLLIDSVVMPDSSFYLIGRDDYINRKRQSLSELMASVTVKKPIIVLDHQPHSINESVMNNADLVLQGHTHNGQLWPYNWLMYFIYEIPYGYAKKGNTQFYVSSGVGCAGPPYRVGTKSEIVVLHIRFV